MWEWMATMLMPASRNDFRAFRNSFSVTAEVPINHRILIITGKCRPGIDAHRAIDGNAMHFRRAPEGEFDHALIHLTADMKNFIQWIRGYCADVRQPWLEERIGRRSMSGAKLPDLVVEKPDGGGKMLNRAFTFDAHKEQSGVIEKEMIVQSGNAQAAFQGHEHRKINFVLE